MVSSESSETTISSGTTVCRRQLSRQRSSERGRLRVTIARLIDADPADRSRMGLEQHVDVAAELLVWTDGRAGKAGCCRPDLPACVSEFLKQLEHFPIADPIRTGQHDVEFRPDPRALHRQDAPRPS